MPKIFVALLFVLGMLAACTQSSTVETAHYQNEKLSIRAEVEPGAFDGLLKVYIGEELVINQRSKAFGGSQQTFYGIWRGKRVRARATSIQKLMSSYVQVDVFIDGTLVETLSI